MTCLSAAARGNPGAGEAVFPAAPGPAAERPSEYGGSVQGAAAVRSAASLGERGGQVAAAGRSSAYLGKLQCAAAARSTASGGERGGAGWEEAPAEQLSKDWLEAGREGISSCRAASSSTMYASRGKAERASSRPESHDGHHAGARGFRGEEEVVEGGESEGGEGGRGEGEGARVGSTGGSRLTQGTPTHTPCSPVPGVVSARSMYRVRPSGRGARPSLRRRGPEVRLGTSRGRGGGKEVVEEEEEGRGGGKDEEEEGDEEVAV